MSLAGRWSLPAFALLVLPYIADAKPAAPALPASVAETIDTLFGAPGFERAEVSPDGAHLAFLREEKGRKVLNVYNFETRSSVAMAGLTGAERSSETHLQQNISHFHWVTSTDLLLAANEGNEYYSGLWMADARFRRCERLPTYDHILYPAAPLPQNPTTALLCESARVNLYPSLWYLDKPSRRIYEGERNPGRVISWMADVAGVVRLAATAEPNSRVGFLYRKSATSPWQPLALPRDSEPVTFDVKGENLLLSAPGAEGRYTMQVFDLAKMEMTKGGLTDPVHDVTPTVIVDPRTGAPLGLRYNAEKPQTLWLHPDIGQLAKMIESGLPGFVISSLNFTEKSVLFGAFSDQVPFGFYRYDFTKREIRPVLSSNPTAAKRKWAAMTPIRFKARDEHPLFGYLTLPAGAKPGEKRPLVALSHGGPGVRDVWGFDPEVQLLASMGFAVLQVNYRGSPGYGRTHELTTNLDVAEKSVDDVADGIRWSIAEGIADPAKVVVYGGSYGGYIALGIATRYPELPCAAIGFAGVYDWAAHYSQQKGGWLEPSGYDDMLRWRRDYHLDVTKHAERYKAISPVFTADKVRCPVLLYHGLIDQSVAYPQSSAMASALKKAGKYVELIRDRDGVHGLPSVKQTIEMYQRLAAFLLERVPATAPSS